ncbi:hypothetical protein BSKO_04487 [Bryopsis sp. KO-2023]|nr:hypothetical protein BSKO_04487 [Bryopsis sp. KO-2023]
MEDIKKMRLQVTMRLRPTAETGIVSTEKRILTIKDPSKGHNSEFVFDNVFNSEASQDRVFTHVGAPLVENVLQGYNACCFAYGQTGSGKTYSMFGKESGEWGLRGLIPRVAESLFKGATSLVEGGQARFSFFVSFLEIYLEHVRDLGKASKALLPASRTKPGISRSRPSSANEGAWDYTKESLDILEDTDGTTFVKDLTYIEVKTVEDILTVLKAGYSLRQTASTGQNDVSSRSHTVFTITTVQFPREGIPGQPKTGRLNMVDLAGSERLKKSHSSEMRLQEAKAINTSLTALGKVVMNLSQEGDRGHVPYRDSKLTRILKESLNGNSYTTLLANLNPTADNFEECFNTLQFALRCSSISTVPHVNILTAGTAQDKMIEQLTHRVAQLTEEVECIHVHYQKLIEEIAGPGYTVDMGPLERGMSAVLDDMLALDTETDEQRTDEGRSPSHARPPSSTSSARRSRKSGSMAGIQKVEQEKRFLDQQLKIEKRQHADCEMKLKRTRQDLNDLKSRMLRAEQDHRDESRRNRQKMKEMQERFSDETQNLKYKIEDEHTNAESEKGRLTGANDTLRCQLNDLASSIENMVNKRSREAEVAEEKARKQKREFESRYKMMTELVEEQTVKDLEIARRESAQLLKRKEGEIKNLRLEMEVLQDKSTTQVCELTEDVQYLMEYNEKLWHIFRHIQTHQYPVQVAKGMKSLKIPPKDKPEDPALTPRIRNIKKTVQKAQAFLSALEIEPQVSLPIDVAAVIELSSKHGSSKKGTTISEGDSRSSKSFHTEYQERPETILEDTRSEPPEETDAEISTAALEEEVEHLKSIIKGLREQKPLEVVREQIEKEVKEELEKQVICELQSHETVHYINNLEEEISR